jgi:hypothetical protein
MEAEITNHGAQQIEVQQQAKRINRNTTRNHTLKYINLFQGTFSPTLTHQDVLVTRAQVQTLYQQQNPHLQSNTQTHLDIWHSTLGYHIQFKH